MRGAIAAGHQVTAETGARVLAAGGNAVDACIAAAFASWVAESTLTGPGGGGFMLVHRAHDRGARLLDFFVAVPGRGLPPHERAAMQQVDVDFDRATSQVFHIGAASVGVPGTPAGLEAAYRAYGTKPWPELVAPAVELAREGIELTRPQAYLHAILDLILRHTDEGRRIYERNGERLIAGDRLTMPDLANTLERIAERGVRELYDGEAGRAIAAYVREHGGDLDEHDLGEYDLVAVSPRPGMRLTSMMAPSMVLRDDLPRLVVGSAGSVRLRGAILQIVNNVVGHGLDVREAIDRPRMHLEEPHVHCEGGYDPAEVDRLEAMGYEVTRWRRRNLYFGGAAAVEVREDGTLAAAGDPRRGGYGVMVEA